MAREGHPNDPTGYPIMVANPRVSSLALDHNLVSRHLGVPPTRSCIFIVEVGISRK